MRRNPLIAPVLLVVALLAAAFFVLWVTSSDSNTPPPTTVDPGDPGDPGGAVTRSGLLLVDGWSVKVLEGATFSVATEDGRDVRPLVLEPADAATVARIREDHQSELTQVVARLSSLGPAAGCSSVSCTDGTGVTLTDEQLVDPGLLPGTGPVFQAWGIQHGLWVAVVDVPEGEAFSLRVSSPRWGSLELGASGGDSLVWPVGAGLGQLFTLDAAWLWETPGPGRNQVPPVASEAPAIRTSPPFLGGLDQPDPSAAGMPFEWLTYLTSPSTGCGVGVVCTPSRVPVTVRDFRTETRHLCADSVRVPVVFEDAIWEVDYPHASHQGGIWSGAEVELWEGEPMLWTGTPSLVEGPATIRVATARVWVSGSPWTLRGIAGHFGFDDPTLMELPTDRVFNGLLPLRHVPGFDWCS
jgi:hypothetical protein